MVRSVDQYQTPLVCMILYFLYISPPVNLHRRISKLFWTNSKKTSYYLHRIMSLFKCKITCNQKIICTPTCCLPRSYLCTGAVARSHTCCWVGFSINLSSSTVWRTSPGVWVAQGCGGLLTVACSIVIVGLKTLLCKHTMRSLGQEQSDW